MAKKLINSILKIGENVLSHESSQLSENLGFDTSGINIEKKADIVIISGSARINTGGFPENKSITVGVVPINYRPKTFLYTGAATVGGNVGYVTVNTNGNLSFLHRTGRNDLSWFGFTIAYFI